MYQASRRATIMSAFLPGLGQAYNKKYWKIPIVYGGLAGFYYMFKTNNDEYNHYRNNLLKMVKDTSVKSIEGLDLNRTETQKLYYRKYRDFGIIGLAAIYFLNIIDANVDGHLQTFDVSDNLSLRIDFWENSFALNNTSSFSGGISLKLTF